MMLRLATVNAFNLYADPDDPSAQQRYRAVESLIAGLNPDIVAVQEIVGHGATRHDAATTGLARLADATGLACTRGDECLVAVGGGSHHTGLLYQPHTVTPTPHDINRLGGDRVGLWHSLITVVFSTTSGGLLRVGSVHLSPYDPDWALRDVRHVHRAMAGDGLPGLVGGDFNGIGAYDEDPYQGVDWHPDHAYQLDLDGTVDRRAGAWLESPRHAKMRDCARITGVAWTATSGHHPADTHPPRRLDRWYATPNLPAEAVRALHTVSPDTVGTCTDHTPVIVQIDPTRLTA